MLSAICFNLDQSKILSSGYGLNHRLYSKGLVDKDKGYRILKTFIDLSKSSFFLRGPQGREWIFREENGNCSMKFR